MSYRLFAVTVAGVARLSVSFRRLTLHDESLADLDWAGADQRVKLLIGSPEQLDRLPAAGEGWYAWWAAQPDDLRPPMRTYTIAAWRPDRNEVDIDVAVHGETGPLSRFALHARPGDRLLLVAPGSGGGAAEGLAWRPGGARQLLCVGDETALPAIRNILATLDPGLDCRAVIEVPDASDRLPLPSPAPVRVEWAVRRAGDPVGAAAERLLFGAATSPASPGEDDMWQEAADAASGPYAWVAGEVGWVNRVRKRLGWANASFMGYWKATPDHQV